MALQDVNRRELPTYRHTSPGEPKRPRGAGPARTKPTFASQHGAAYPHEYVEPGRMKRTFAIERIAFDGNLDAVPIKRVNPLELHGGDQIHAVGESR